MTAHESSSAKRALKPQRGAHAPKFIAIEGPLRVGKSTLARILAERLHARRVYDCEDNPFLGEFYKEAPGSALRAQMYFLFERQKRLREALATESPAPLLSDFLMEKDRIFANLNLDDEELKLYERYYGTLTSDLPAPDLRANLLRRLLDERRHRPVAGAAAHAVGEVAQDVEPVFGVYDLGVK